MANQSLYRRYRPRRFAELKGQDHVVRALRNAVAGEREAQAYLFSGPRGTGKTTSARILAKVLNCEAPVDGEPCCQCESCRSVEAGTSYDVFELDAASNNGVDEIRNLTERAALGTPGRHKVYILDEVHMLSKGATAALLKTLEEPPAHVVFVLATTDPQKVPETIRSRTQHLQFHLLPADELEAHLRWVVADAGLDVDDDALQSVLEQSGGSARDALSALELVAVSGGSVEVAPRLGDLLDALADQDTGLALATIAHAVQQGRQARTLSEDILRELRDAFLTLMAPELVQVASSRAETLADQARRVGAPRLVRAMEVIGEVLIEMRHAPDPRLLLEVAFVKLTNAEVDPGVASLLTRLKHLEDLVAQGALAPPERPLPVDPSTGRVQVGARARQAADARPVVSPPEAPAAVVPAVAPPPAPPPTPAEPSAAARHGDIAKAQAAWKSVIDELRPTIARALFAAARPDGERDGHLVVVVPNEPHRGRALEHRETLERALAAVAGGPVRIELVIRDEAPHVGAPGAMSAAAPVVPPPDPEVVDLDELTDAPPGEVETTVDRLAKAFPGAELVEEHD
jgi:DNA polymerase-3 subunit gamma/tau